MRALKNLLSFALALSSIHLSFAQGAEQQPSEAKRKFKHEGKIEVLYDRSKNQTAVVLHPYVISRSGPLDSKAIVVGTMFSGEKPDTPPESIELRIISTSRSGYDFSEENELTALADNERIPLGTLKRIKASPLGTPPRLYYREDLAVAIPYADFLKLVKAKKLSLRAGKREVKLDNEHLEALRDLASRLVQV